MMQMREGLCPKCGKTLQIPAELEKFSCLYCGTRLSVAQLCQALPELTADDARELYERFLDGALHAAVGYPQSMEQMSKVLFFPYFEQYYGECAPAFEALERWVMAQQTQDVLSQAAKALLERIEAWFQAQKGWKFKARQTEIRERTKFTIAIFFVPALCKAATVVGKRFAEIFREQWLVRYPDSPFELATYEELAGGFKKRPFCFITTAVCEYQGQPDDCAMLMDFRAFRDGYLSSTPDGKALVERYYEIAPGIVSRIDFCEARDVIYDRLYREYLAPCHQALCAGQQAKCRDLYVEMMSYLSEACSGKRSFYA